MHRSGNSFISSFDSALSSFCRTFGASDDTIFPGVETVVESRLHQILCADTAPNHVALLHERGLLTKDIRYFTPNQVGGMNTHATDPGRAKGEHVMSNGRVSLSSFARSSLANVTDDGEEKGVHTKSNGNKSMPLYDRGQNGGTKSHRTEPGEDNGVHTMRNGNKSKSSSIRAKNAGTKSHRTDAGEARGVHTMKKGGKTKSSSERARHAGMGRRGTCLEKDFFMSIVQVDETTKKPLIGEVTWFADTKASINAHLSRIGAVASYGSAYALMKTHYDEMKNDSNRTSVAIDVSKNIVLTPRKTNIPVYFVLTKYAKLPPGAKIIDNKLVEPPTGMQLFDVNVVMEESGKKIRKNQKE